MGSPDFAVVILKALAGSYPVVGVVTQPDRPTGRSQTLLPPAVKLTALELGLPILQPEKLRLPEAAAQLARWNPALIIVAAFGQILRPAVLDLPALGCVNVHASLLPRWRGAAPIQAAILAGDSDTGITIMKMDPGIDTGPILSQRSLPILLEDTTGSLRERLARLGADLLLATLPDYLAGKLVPRPQPEAGATYASMVKKEDELLDFSQTAQVLERRVRALHPSPGAHFMVNGNPVKVWRASVAEGTAETGEHLVHQGKPAVGTSHGLLVLEEIQPAGKKPMPGKAFLTGARDWTRLKSDR